MTKKNYIIIAVLIIVAIIGFVWWSDMKKAEAPEPQESAMPIDTTDAIQEDLADINIGDIDAEFKDVDAAINEL